MLHERFKWGQDIGLLGEAIASDNPQVSLSQSVFVPVDASSSSVPGSFQAQGPWVDELGIAKSCFAIVALVTWVSTMSRSHTPNLISVVLPNGLLLLLG